MSLSSISITRPVLAVVFSLLIVIFGIVGFMYLGVREYPAVDPPVITVTTNYSGANADVMESQITEPLEQSLNGIDGISQITSTSREQVSIIRVEFSLEMDLEAAANDVRDRVSRALRLLPKDIDNPIVEKSDANGESLVFLTVSSDTKNVLEVSDIASNIIKEKIQTIQGVSNVRIFGEKKYAMRIWLDPARMAAAGITPLDVQAALNRENIELPSGRIEGDNTELSVRTSGLLENEEDFNNLVILENESRVVKLRDIGNAELGAENPRTGLKRFNEPMVGVAVQPQPGANAIEIADEFYKRLEILKKEIPADIKINIGYDFTTFVRKAITEVEETLFIAFGLVVLIIFIFLRDWRSTLIPVLAIPVSIVSSFFIMYVAGFSINVLTLMAIVLAIGLVCDDAIVVLENIYGKIEEGKSPIEAAREGANEIYFAVISTTITLAAVFLPVIFLQGLTGRLFREFGVVIAGSVLVSAFVALTLSPMMSAKLLKHSEKKNWFYRKTEPFFVSLTQSYRDSLENFMKLRWSAWLVIIASFGLIVVFLDTLKKELAPLEDRSNIRVSVSAPEGSTFEFMERNMDMLSEYVKDSIPEVTTTISITSPGFAGTGTVNTGTQNIYITEPTQRVRTQDQIFEKISKDLKNYSSIRTTVVQPPTIGSRLGGPPLQFVILAPHFDSLKIVLPKFLEEARKSPVLSFIDSDLKFNKPELRLKINRERATQLGVSTEAVARTLQLSFSGQRFGYFIRNGKQYQIIGQVERRFRDDPQDLTNLFVRNNRGELVQIDNLVSFEEESNPTSRFRFNRYASATVQGNVNKGYTLGDGIKALNEVKAKVLNDNYSTALSGQAKDFSDSSSSLLFAFSFALILIYLVLAAQFESFIDPIIILVTVPMAMAGAMLTLWYFDMTFNIFSQIGIIMLIGLVTKNGILIVEFANQKKESGSEKTVAVKESAVQRLRPILMTSLATILGVLPIALSLGAGGGSRQSLGVAVVGGLIFSGFLTLYVIPAIYSYVSSKKYLRKSEPFKNEIYEPVLS
jgi:multidrug efflux pump